MNKQHIRVLLVEDEPAHAELVRRAFKKYSDQQVRKALQKEETVDQITKGVFELNLVTYEYVLNHRNRTRIQWQLRYDSLTKLIRSEISQIPEEQILLHEIRQNYENLQAIFSQLVTTYTGGKNEGERIIGDYTPLAQRR